MNANITAVGEACAIVPVETGQNRTVTGFVASVYSRRYGGAIFRIEPLDRKGDSIVVKASSGVLPSDPVTGEIWSITGHLESSTTYGPQLIPSNCWRLQPSGDIIIDFLAKNPRFPGISEERAKHLWAVFGMRLYDVFNNGDYDALVDPKQGRIPPRFAQQALEAWIAYKAEAPVILWLHQYQFPRSLATIIREYYGPEAIDKLTEDPYRMLAFAPWEKVDRVAQRLGVQPNDPRREAAAVEAVLYDYYDDGHTAATRRMLEDGLKRKLGPSFKGIHLLSNAWQDRVVEFIGEDLFQTAGCFAMEQEITERIHHMLEGEEHQETLFPVKFSREKLQQFERNESERRKEAIELNPEQVAAIEMVINHRLSLIKGPPGTGKTTLLRAIIHQLGPDQVIHQIALTGRAAKRMRDASGLPAKTIAAFLIKAHKEDLGTSYWLFIDEASMIDVPMMVRILEILPAGAHLCLIGDEHQLPPVGPGLVFHAMVKSRRIPQTTLVQVHRAAKESGIPQVAGMIRDQKVPQLDTFSGTKTNSRGVTFITADSMEDVRKAALRTYRELAELEDGDIQVIAARNTTCDVINNVLHAEHLDMRDEEGLPIPLIQMNACHATIGDPILHQNRNDYSRDLYNGTLGVLTDIFTEADMTLDAAGNEVQYVAVAEFDGAGLVKLTDADFDYLTLGYAITGHKSQGSEWDRVIVICEDSRVVDNTWLYTVTTRGKKQIIIIGSPAIFAERVSNPPKAHQRVIGMKL